jgi:amino acid transporter
LNPKTIVLLAFAVVSFIAGMVDQYFYPGVAFPPSAIAYAIVGILLIFAWYRLDSDQRGYRRSIALNASVIAIAVVGLPWYLFRSRGAKRGLIATLIAVVLYVVFAALSLAGGYAAYYGLQT